jgi:L-fuculose-phosphate aldolase
MAKAARRGARAEAAARRIVRCCRRLWEAGLVAGADGNVSVRLAPDRILVTPRGRLKAELTAADLVQVDLDGRVTGRRSGPQGYRLPTTELDLHLRLYRQSPECGAVVHAHPPIATGFATAGVPLAADVLPELVLLAGDVPLLPYARPGTPAVGDLVEPIAATHGAALLANHGAVTWAADLERAQIRMESVEHAARILLVARTLGGATALSAAEVRALTQPRGRL